MSLLYWIFIGWWWEPIKFMFKLISRITEGIFKIALYICVFAFIFGIILAIIGVGAKICIPVIIIAFALKIIFEKKKKTDASQETDFYSEQKYNPNSNKIPSEERINTYNDQFDYMTGEDFEAYIASTLKKIVYTNIQLTKGSGDQGVDILAEKDGIKYAFQCKRYDKPVGNKAVQEVFAGRFFYHCHVAIVVTNNYFTQSAKDLAHENGVVLWDRDYIQRLVGMQNKKTEVSTGDNILKKYNENRGKNNLRIFDIEEKIVAIEDGEVSKILYQYIEGASRIAIDMYLDNGNENPYTDDMIKNIEKPIHLYNAKFFKLSEYVLNFVYYCDMNENFKNTFAYNEFRKNINEYDDDLFKISVFYDIDDILANYKEIKINNVPEINIETDDMEGIKLEDIDEFKIQAGGEYLVTENFFPMKIDNIKF